MSRSRSIIILVLAATLVAGMLLVSGLVVARAYFTIAETTSTLPTPAPLVISTAVETIAPTTTITAMQTTLPNHTAVPAMIPATPVPATAVTVYNTAVQYVLALGDINIRRGPGTGYDVVGWVAGGQTVKVIGVNGDNNWWRVVCPDNTGDRCWVTAGSQYTQPTTAPGSQPTATAVPTTCTDAATLITDVTVPDGTQFAPNTPFVKTWRIQNSGTCTWDQRYKLVHAGGHTLGAASTGFPLPATVAPGQSIDLSISLVAPATPQTYQGDWKLQNSQTQPFGVGRNSSPFWVKIVVPPTQPTRITGLVYQDINQNGVYDGGEPLQANREVWLVPGTACHVRADAVAVVWSGGDGRYTLAGDFNGSYCVGLSGSGGLDDVASVAIASGQTLDGIHLKANIANGSITGWLWDDTCLPQNSGGNCISDGNGGYRADGMIQASEGYIAGVTILLQMGSCATGNPTVPVSAVTDASGKYTFNNLLPGTYCVFMNAASPGNLERLLPGDWTFPAPGIWYQQIILMAGEQVTPVNFGWDYQFN